MNTPKLGISNLLPLVLLGAELGNVGDEMGRTKGMARYMVLTKLADEAMSLPKVDFKAAKAELKDLDQAEKEIIKDAFKQKFDIKNDVLEGQIEEALDILEAQFAVVDRAVTLIKGLKSA